jgi:hypothetical protein
MAFDLPDLTCLAWDPTRDFWTGPLPEPTDTEIAELLRRAWDDGRLDELIAAVRPDPEATTLRRSAFRLASLAVRRRDPSLLRSGLVAIGVASRHSLDPRDEIWILAPLWHAARLLDPDPEEEFRGAAAAVPATDDLFLAWSSRSPESQSLGEFLFWSSSDEGGFRFVRADWRPAGSSGRPPLFGRFRRRLVGLAYDLRDRRRRPSA